jgi:uncharacterized YigZ family protein
MEKRGCFEPVNEGRAEIEVKKSRFLGHAIRVVTVEEARRAVEDEGAGHPHARHVVYAFIVGGLGSETSGMSDDGEPKKTAGRPVLEVLKGRGASNILLTVTRYFGGTKLGTGGLVRAYTECAQETLRNTELRQVILSVEFSLRLPYENYDMLRRMLLAHEAVILGEEFGDEVHIRATVREESISAVQAEAQNITRGRCEFITIEETT